MKQTDSSEPPSRRGRVGVVILAAGQGTRMRSRLPKVLHPVAGVPMVRQALDVGRCLEPSVLALVVGRAAEQVAAAAGDHVRIVHQAEQLGTGHAVLQAREALRGRSELVLVMFADTVLVRRETLDRMLQAAERSRVVILTGEVEDPHNYGRIVRDGRGRIVRIVEPGDAGPEHEGIREINSGVMVLRADWLWEQVGRLPRHANGELYVTDLVAAALEQGHSVASVKSDDPAEIWGINTQAQLAAVNRVALDRVRRRLMDAGVRMPDPTTVYPDSAVLVEADVVLHPNTHLQGRTSIAAGTEIGPNSIVRDTTVGRECRVVASVLEESRVGDGVSIGPFAHLRPGARIEDGVELGNYAEVKASTVGAGSRIHHFSYVGDATVGRDTNVGAGTITCNYDGAAKHRTVVGDRVFIGSDTMLVAPVSLGDDARTGAGSVVTRDVPPGQLVVGVPARPVPGRRGTPEPAADADQPPLSSRQDGDPD